jgi:hypothetical protein
MKMQVLSVSVHGHTLTSPSFWAAANGVPLTGLAAGSQHLFNCQRSSYFSLP